MKMIISGGTNPIISTLFEKKPNVEDISKICEEIKKIAPKYASKYKYSKNDSNSISDSELIPKWASKIITFLFGRSNNPFDQSNVPKKFTLENDIDEDEIKEDMAEDLNKLELSNKDRSVYYTLTFLNGKDLMTSIDIVHNKAKRTDDKIYVKDLKNFEREMNHQHIQEEKEKNEALREELFQSLSNAGGRKEEIIKRLNDLDRLPLFHGLIENYFLLQRKSENLKEYEKFMQENQINRSSL